ncbi:hypothetical protein LINGRAHAP2_LOCUS4634 [Linum grandiflorum]
MVMFTGLLMSWSCGISISRLMLGTSEGYMSSPITGTTNNPMTKCRGVFNEDSCVTVLFLKASKKQVLGSLW